MARVGVAPRPSRSPLRPDGEGGSGAGREDRPDGGRHDLAHLSHPGSAAQRREEGDRLLSGGRAYPGRPGSGRLHPGPQGAACRGRCDRRLRVRRSGAEAGRRGGARRPEGGRRPDRRGQGRQRVVQRRPRADARRRAQGPPRDIQHRGRRQGPPEGRQHRPCAPGGLGDHAGNPPGRGPGDRHRRQGDHDGPLRQRQRRQRRLLPRRPAPREGRGVAAGRSEGRQVRAGEGRRAGRRRHGAVQAGRAVAGRGCADRQEAGRRRDHARRGESRVAHALPPGWHCSQHR